MIKNKFNKKKNIFIIYFLIFYRILLFSYKNKNLFLISKKKTKSKENIFNQSHILRNLYITTHFSIYQIIKRKKYSWGKKKKIPLY